LSLETCCREKFRGVIRDALTLLRYPGHLPPPLPLVLLCWHPCTPPVTLSGRGYCTTWGTPSSSWSPHTPGAALLCDPGFPHRLHASLMLHYDSPLCCQAAPSPPHPRSATTLLSLPPPRNPKEKGLRVRLSIKKKETILKRRGVSRSRIYLSTKTSR
jgi:hypothetical protein